MFSPEDTIVAIATPPGRGGLGVVRISGPLGVRGRRTASWFARRRWRRATPRSLASAASPQPSARVQWTKSIATWFPAPHSYTGEHSVEISTHGSPVILQAVLRSAIAAGARLARPGEFTFRAFLNGRIDLIQAEAVADLIDAVTPLQARVAFDQLEGTLTARIKTLDSRLLDLVARLEASLDFPDEGYHFIEPQAIACAVTSVIEELDALLRASARGRIIRDGATVVIAGRPNVGKSSLFNALLGQARAIVTETAGTTRDLVTETCDLDGLKVTLVDTAGVRETIDRVELEGVSRARARARGRRPGRRRARRHRSVDRRRRAGARRDGERVSRLVVANKSDRPAAWSRDGVDARCPRTSGAGLDASASGDGGGARRRRAAARSAGDFKRSSRGAARACANASDAGASGEPLRRRRPRNSCSPICTRRA